VHVSGIFSLTDQEWFGFRLEAILGIEWIAIKIVDSVKKVKINLKKLIHLSNSKKLINFASRSSSTICFTFTAEVMEVLLLINSINFFKTSTPEKVSSIASVEIDFYML